MIVLLRSYFTLSDIRLPFLVISDLTKVNVKVTLRLTAGEPVSLGVEPHVPDVNKVKFKVTLRLAAS
jgi:hypothetical protein